MGVVFIGAVEEGYQTLKALLQHPGPATDIKGIVTLTPEKGTKLSGIKSFDELAEDQGIPLYKVTHIRNVEAVDLVGQLAPDLIVVVGWTQLLGEEMLKTPRFGTVGLHTTLLPKHRGRAPIPWAIIKGLGKSGNTLFYFTPGVDDGDIIDQKDFYITLDDTAGSVYRKATQAGIDLLLEHWSHLKRGTVPRRPQEGGLVDHWPRRRPKDGLIDWRRTALEVHNLIRGVTRPYPGAFTFLRGKKMMVWSSKLLGKKELYLDSQPGVILDTDSYSQGLIIGTGDVPLLVNEVQFEGGQSLSAFDFSVKEKLRIGEGFSSAPGEVDQG